MAAAVPLIEGPTLDEATKTEHVPDQPTATTEGLYARRLLPQDKLLVALVSAESIWFGQSLLAHARSSETSPASNMNRRLLHTRL
jgi:hypothetical protein